MRDRVQFFSKNIFVGMIEKGVELKKTESCENKKKDGFWSSDGEFEGNVALIAEKQRVFKLRNQIRRIRKEHSIEIFEKDEKIAELENSITKQGKTSIKCEELERKLKAIQNENQELKDELDKTKMRFSAYQDVGDRMRSRIETDSENLKRIQLEIQRQRKQLKEKEFEIERLKNELNEFKNESSDFQSYSQEQSQAIYTSFVSESTENFLNKHVVPDHLSHERHEYAKKLGFWNFNNGSLETQISSYYDSNFIGEKNFCKFCLY